MILLIDSGATNSTWKFMHSDEHFEIHKRKGINLSTTKYQSWDLAFSKELGQKVKRIFFLGAGTGHLDKENEFQTFLKLSFPNVKAIEIESDLYSAGWALSEGQACIICILGTGSNCCTFENNRLVHKVNNLGYILGDEGSGFDMGRRVLRSYFYGLMESKDSTLFEKTYGIDRDALIQNVYHRDQASNTYIASFCDFLAVSSAELRAKISCEALEHFFEKQVSCLPGARDLVCHFSGSISWYFQSEIREICRKYDYKVGNIIQNPIDSLTYSKLIAL